MLRANWEMCHPFLSKDVQHKLTPTPQRKGKLYAFICWEFCGLSVSKILADMHTWSFKPAEGLTVIQMV